MTKSEFVFQVAEKTGMTKKDAELAAGAVFETLAQVLAAGDKLQFPGFGTFKTRVRPPFTGRHPVTGAPLEIKETAVPVFEPSRQLKEKVKQSHAAG